MVIAVNTSFTAGNLLERDFIVECFSILTANYPQHQFIYICDSAFDLQHSTAKNITVINLGAPAKKPLLLQYRLNYKIPSLLRKHKADVFVSSSYCSLKSKVPQCIIIHDLSFLQQPGLFSKSWLRFYKNNTAKFLAKATTVITTSQLLQQQITRNYKIPATNTRVCYYGVSKHFIPVKWQLKNTIKESYTEGKEYFLYSGTIEPGNNLVALLKAFSFFKKRQKSNMQLVLACKSLITDKDFVKSLSSYKYRNEVQLLENIAEDSLAKITASAYALVYPVIQQEGFCLPAAEAMLADTPVIATHNNSIIEICGDAALYINACDFNDIADKMMLLFKDEDKRNELIVKGRQKATANNYNWDSTTAVVWDAIVKAF